MAGANRLRSAGFLDREGYPWTTGDLSLNWAAVRDPGQAISARDRMAGWVRAMPLHGVDQNGDNLSHSSAVPPPNHGYGAAGRNLAAP